MPIISVVWVISYYWWMVSYLIANSIQLQQALKLVHPNIPRDEPCWSRIVTSNMALKQGQKTRLNGDKLHTVFKMGYSKCQQGQGLLLWIYETTAYLKFRPGMYKLPTKPHCCSKSLKPFSLTHRICLCVSLSSFILCNPFVTSFFQSTPSGFTQQIL